MIMYIEMKYCKYHIVYIIISILTTVTEGSRQGANWRAAKVC